MTNILVGTTSWTEKTLLDSKRFYPSNATTSAARLRYYATQFRIVEVDSSYYGLPAERNSLLWAERTPQGFVFDVKAFRLFTQHQTPLPVLPKDIVETLGGTKRKNLYYTDLPNEAREELWRRFRLSLEPLRKAEKLGVVLFQFPPWFVYKPSGLEYIAHCAEMLTGDQVAVEFRHRSWLNEKHADEVLAFERKHNLAHVVVDEPQGFVSSIPAKWEVTCQSVAVVRLHGRNRQTWEKKGLSTAAERFRYLYSQDELQELAPPIKSLAKEARMVHVLFNNCYGDDAQRNALDLRRFI
jgi:uncharacterized protein YecE (DUF72 family)